MVYSRSNTLNEYTGVLEFFLMCTPYGHEKDQFFALQFSMEYVELQKGDFDYWL